MKIKPVNGSWCPECGPDVSVDEDGCCKTCGADACGEGSWLDLGYRARVSALEATVERVENHRSQDAAEVEDIFRMNALIGDGSVELSRKDVKRVLSILRAPVPAALAPQEKPEESHLEGYSETDRDYQEKT